ncbi:MAG: OsmC family protein [Candidatus Dormibacteraeota bacterium]|nr:OsmC family protein [Candidatus Dormibacteraeota bacterium]
MRIHDYRATVTWTGNTGSGTTSYGSYSRDHEVRAPNRPPILGSSDPDFRGDPSRYSPEELLVSALSACHMLWYLHLCATSGLNVTAYTDEALGEMTEHPDGSGQFRRVTLHPRLELAAPGDLDLARELHRKAHRLCFIARSVNFEVLCQPEVIIRAGAGR